VDLRFDHPHRTAQVTCGVFGLLRSEGNSAARGRDPELRQQALGLIFVNVHELSFAVNSVKKGFTGGLCTELAILTAESTATLTP
jgi:hypothetical protein